jgi:hypothetical protein
MLESKEYLDFILFNDDSVNAFVSESNENKMFVKNLWNRSNIEGGNHGLFQGITKKFSGSVWKEIHKR